MQRAARRCRATYQAIIHAMPRQPWNVPDETGWRIGGRLAWLHVFVAERITGYVIDRLRGIDVAQRVLGGDEDELAAYLDPGVQEALIDPDDVPAPPDEAITQPGDLWILGNHRRLCGDSASAADVDRLLDEAKVHLVNTDPPYNVKVEPRSNNAIAAGLSSFPATEAKRRGKLKHHQGLDLGQARVGSRQ